MQKGFIEEGATLYTADAAAQIPVIAEFNKICKEKGIPVFLSAFVQDHDYHNAHYWFRNKERGLLKEDGNVGLKKGTEEGKLMMP